MDAFGSFEDCHDAVGDQAAFVWAKHRDLAGVPPEAQRGLADILLRPTKRAPDPVRECRVRARLYPQSSAAGPSFQLSAAIVTSSSAAGSNAIDESKLLLQDIYEVYIAAGAAGAKWLDIPAGNDEHRQKIITMPLGRRFDNNQLKAQLGFMRRWNKWCGGVTPSVAPYSPAAIDSAFFLQQHSEGKPTVALNLFNNMKWWTKHVGVPFNVEHSAVAAFGVMAP